MISITDKTTYEDLREAARDQSAKLGRCCAVVEIVTYMGSRSRTTIVTSMTPIKSQQRGGEFVGVMCQFRNGKPCG
jgi:hypothetical protein